MRVWALAILLFSIASAALAADIRIEATENGRIIRVDGLPLLDIGSPQLTGNGFEQIYRFPGQAPATPTGAATADNAHGQWTETISRAEDGMTIRYDFDLPPDTKAARLQWNWRLDASAWAGAMAVGTHGPLDQAERSFALQPIEELQISDLRQITLARPEADIVLTCRAADGAWSFRQGRGQERGKSFRLDYSRPTEIAGRRTGWFEITITAKTVQSSLDFLTSGTPVKIHGLDFQPGAVRDPIKMASSTLLFLHTVDEAPSRGEPAGEITVTYSDGSKASIQLRSEEELASPTDDPHDVLNGRLATLPDRTFAWITPWRNPQPAKSIERLEARSLAGNWRLLAASAVIATAEPHRVEMTLRGASAPPAQETAIPLDGTWQFSAEGIEPRDIAVPSFWERQAGLGDVHVGTYRRQFDLPAGLAGQRISVCLDAVGDAAEVLVNGRMVGRQISAGLPLEVDITAAVSIPSTANKLEVRVLDDTYFGIPIEAPAWRAARHWIPRGMGTNNRKGLYQSVSLRARPAVHISDVRVQTSVRNGELVAMYRVHNSGKAAVQAQIALSVHPSGGGGAVMSLPAVNVELPGYVTTEVTVRGPFSGVELWQPDHPTLYSLRSILTSGEKRLERVDTRFGFREVWFEGENFYLNGIRCNLRGESPAYAEKSEPMASREAAAEMIRRYQRVNFNVLRFHAMPAPPHVLDLCDEMGMLVIDESAIYASWGMLMPEHGQFMENCRDHLTRWVRRDRNHPSVVLWSGDNEGLNVSLLTPAQLAQFRKVIDEEDGTRPVTFDGDGSGMGASPASIKHYVRTVADLQDRGGAASGYARDLRNDIYWATEYDQDIPLGCGEFLYPEGRQRGRERELAYMMGLQTRGYRLANWFDIRPYNPSMIGFIDKGGVKPGFEEAYEIIRKSFAPVAVFDKEFDALGPYPAPPVLAVGQAAKRELLIYNDAFSDESVEIEWVARQGDARVAGERLNRTIPLGGHASIPIEFTPSGTGELQLELISRKGGKETYRDIRPFIVR